MPPSDSDYGPGLLINKIIVDKILLNTFENFFGGESVLFYWLFFDFPTFFSYIFMKGLASEMSVYFGK